MPEEGNLNVGLNVHLGRGPLGRVAGKKASNTDLTYIKKTKTRLYNAKNPCGIDKRDGKLVLLESSGTPLVLGETNLESTGKLEALQLLLKPLSSASPPEGRGARGRLRHQFDATPL